MIGVSEAVRAELRDTDIEVSCVMPGVVNTELASGLPSARGVKNVEPEEVAAEIVGALEHPRFDVYVPRAAGTITKVIGVLPRGAREAVGRALKADKVLPPPTPRPAAATSCARRSQSQASRAESLRSSFPRRPRRPRKDSCTYSKPPSSAPARWAERSPR